MHKLDSYAPKKRRIMGEINVVPYIDVMLVLLIIFMITAPMLTTGVEVDLPDAKADPLPPDENQPITLTIDANGLFYLEPLGDKDVAIDQQTIRLRVGAALKRKPETPVAVRADTNVPHGTVIDAMLILQAAGATKVGFVTDPIDSN
jgi:biopolymer transport protein TolR